MVTKRKPLMQSKKKTKKYIDIKMKYIVKNNFVLREIPTIIHGLNLVPTQGELRDLIAEVDLLL